MPTDKTTAASEAWNDTLKENTKMQDAVHSYDNRHRRLPSLHSLNDDLRRALASAIAACVASASEAENCVHANNPKWAWVADELDLCTDILREVEGLLNAEF